jgi:hypothetical protein
VQKSNINTLIITQVLNAIKAAESSNQREVRIDITTAKSLSHTLGLVMTRLAGDYEGLIQLHSAKSSEEVVVKVEMDGGSWDKKPQ